MVFADYNLIKLNSTTHNSSGHPLHKIISLMKKKLVIHQFWLHAELCGQVVLELYRPPLLSHFSLHVTFLLFTNIEMG